MSPDLWGNEHHEQRDRRHAGEEDGIRPQGPRQFQQLADSKKESGHRQDHSGSPQAVDSRGGPCNKQNYARTDAPNPPAPARDSGSTCLGYRHGNATPECASIRECLPRATRKGSNPKGRSDCCLWSRQRAMMSRSLALAEAVAGSVGCFAAFVGYLVRSSPYLRLRASL